jgi:effector-binding domain-containing protein
MMTGMPPVSPHAAQDRRTSASPRSACGVRYRMKAPAEDGSQPRLADRRANGRVVPATTPAGKAAVTAHWGSYETLEHAYADLHAWMQGDGYEPAGSTMWEEYFSPPGTPAAQTRTVIYWPIQRRSRCG